MVAFRWRAGQLAGDDQSAVQPRLERVLAIAATGVGISLGSLVGLVTVFGISARNSILQTGALRTSGGRRRYALGYANGAARHGNGDD